MSIAGNGDRLARGQKSAMFSGGVGDGELKPSLAPANEPRNEDIPSVVDNSALFAAKKPEVFYRGKPFYGRVLVIPVELKGNSSIIVPDSAKEKSEVGRIVAFSDDSQLKKWGLSLGSMILFDRYAAVGQQFPLLNEQGENIIHLLLQECDVQMELTEVRIQPEPVPEIPAEELKPELVRP